LQPKKVQVDIRNALNVAERHLKRICIVQNVDSLYCLKKGNILSEVKVGIPPTNKLVGIFPTNFMGTDIKRAKAKGSLRDINYYCYNTKGGNGVKLHHK
jgi:hypothetical protein